MTTQIRDILDGARVLFTEQPELARTTTRARAILGAGTSVEVTAGGFTFHADEPEVAGGSGSAPSPIQLALGSLAACTAITYRYWSELLDIPIGNLAVEVRASGDLRGILGLDSTVDPAPVASTTVRVDGPATDDDYVRLHHEVESHCPVQQLFCGARTVGSRLEIDRSARHGHRGHP